MFSDIQDVWLFHGDGDGIGYYGGVHYQEGCRCDLVDKNTGIALPVCEVRVEWRGNGTINDLECSEEEGVICGARFDMSIECSVHDINKEGWWEEGYSFII